MQEQSEGNVGQSPRPLVELPKSVGAAIMVIAVVALFSALYLARALFLPIFLAIILSLTLQPIVRTLSRRGLPAGFISILLILLLASGLLVVATGLSQPVQQWIDDAPRIAFIAKQRLGDLTQPMEAIRQAEEQVQAIADSPDSTAAEVVVRQGGFMSRTADDVVSIAATILITLALSLFILAHSDTFYEKLIKSLPRLSDKKRAFRIFIDTERTVSRYLLTIAAINLTLGLAVGAVMALLGLPDPFLWGLLAGLLNFMPYLGALVGLSFVSVAALITFDSIGYAALIPLSYFALTTLEGHFLTPIILGRQLKLNAVAILLSVLIWGFVWGIIGMLIAVPILIIVKVFCDHVESLKPFGEFLSAADRDTR